MKKIAPATRFFLAPRSFFFSCFVLFSFLSCTAASVALLADPTFVPPSIGI